MRIRKAGYIQTWDTANPGNLGTQTLLFVGLLALNIMEEAFLSRQMRNEHSLLMAGNKSTRFSADLQASPLPILQRKCLAEGCFISYASFSSTC